jgi:hypothetical protein
LKRPSLRKKRLKRKRKSSRSSCFSYSATETPYNAKLRAGRGGPSPAQRRTCQDEHAQRTPPAAACARRFAAKSAPAGQRHTNHPVPSPSASGSGEIRRIGMFTVSAACCADLVWIYREPQPLSTPWPWRRPVVAAPIQPYPVIRGRRA